MKQRVQVQFDGTNKYIPRFKRGAFRGKVMQEGGETDDETIS